MFSAKLYEFPPTETVLVMQAYAVVAVSFAGRGCEFMKRKAAVALATSAQEPAASTSEPSDVHLIKSHCREGLITINIYNSTFTGHGDSPVINFSGSTFNI